MIEKHIVLEDVDPVIFYGINNCHLQMFKSLFPKLHITARDNVICILGDEEDLAKAESILSALACKTIPNKNIKDKNICFIIFYLLSTILVV